MRPFVFPKALATSLGSVVAVGLWVGQMGVALAQTETVPPWSCYSHPKWGWTEDQSVSPSLATTAQDSGNPDARQNHSDPTSALNPDWDSVPTEATWNTPTEMTDSEKSEPQRVRSETDDSSSTFSEEPTEDPSVSLSETGEAISPSQQSEASSISEDGEVQSIQEYFQRYGQPDIKQESQNQDALSSETAEPSSPSSETAEMSLSEEDSISSPEEPAEAGQKSQDAEPATKEDQKGGEAEDGEATEELETHQMPEDSEETPTAPEETQPIMEEETSTESPQGQEEQEEQMDGQGEENNSQEGEIDRGENMEGHMNSSGASQEQNGQETAQASQPSETPLEPSESPEVSTPTESAENEESSEEVSSPWGYEPGYPRVEAEYPLHPETAPSSNAEPSAPAASENASQPKGLPEEEHFTPSAEFLPADRYEYPEPPQEETEQTPSDSANMESSPMDAEGAEENSYPLQAEDSIETDSPSPLPENQDTAQNNPPEEMDREDQSAQGAWDAHGDGWIEENPETSFGSQSQPDLESESSLSPGQSRSGHPTLLEGFGQSLLQLFEPWRKTFSGLLDISVGP